MPELTKQEIAERIGLEVPVEETEETTTEDQKQETPPEEKETPKSEDEETEEADDSEDEEEADEEDESDDEEDEPRSRAVKSKTRTVPYSLLKTERERRKALAGEIKNLREEIADIRATRKGTNADDEIDEIEKEAESLGKELNLEDSKGLAKVLRKSVELARKELEKNGEKLTPELKEKLKLLEQVEARERANAETAHFDKEWDSLAPDIKKEYPQITEAQLKQAKEEMNGLAHSKELHKFPLDYILYKKKDVFSTIFKTSPSKKGMERPKDMSVPEGEEEENLVNIEDMTPEVMKAREQKRLAGSYDQMNDFRVHNPIES